MLKAELIAGLCQQNFFELGRRDAVMAVGGERVTDLDLGFSKGRQAQRRECPGSGQNAQIECHG